METQNSSTYLTEVLQGDTLAPNLFIISLEYMLRTSIDKIKETASSWQREEVLWNSRGISVHAFEFGWAENLSAQHMGCLGVRLKQVSTRVRASGWRCHSDVITVRHDTGWQGAGDVTHRKHAEVCVRNWRKEESGFGRRMRRIYFGARRREAYVRPMGAARVGGQMNKTA